MRRTAIPCGVRRSEANVELDEFASYGGVGVQQESGRDERSDEKGIQPMPATEEPDEAPYARSAPGSATSISGAGDALEFGRHLGRHLERHLER